MYNLLKKLKAEFAELPIMLESIYYAPDDIPATRIIMNEITIKFCRGINSNTVSSVMRGLSNV